MYTFLMLWTFDDKKIDDTFENRYIFVKIDEFEYYLSNNSF